MRRLVLLAALVLGCDNDEVGEDPSCFAPTRPQADMSPGKGCECQSPQPDQVVNGVRYRCQGTFGTLQTDRWFVVTEK